MQTKHLFSNKDLAVLIGPLIVEQFLVISLGLVDIIMASTLGEDAVSAISLSDSINVLITGLFGALATGGAVVCAHYLGSKNTEKVSVAAKQLIYGSILISLALTIPCLIFQHQILNIIFGKIDAHVMHSSNIYFFYSLLSYPLIALYSAAAALFRAQGNSRTPMIVSVVVNIINFAGNAICIYALGWDIEGVAVPSLIARGAGAVILFVMLYYAGYYRGKAPISIKGISKISFDFRIIKNIMGIGIPNGIENSVFQIGKILVLTLMAGFGTSAVAANAAATALTNFNALPGLAMELAIIPVVGQALGAGKPHEAIYLNRKLIIITYVLMIIVNIPLIITTKQIMGIFNLNEQTEILAINMYTFHNIVAMLIWPLSFVMPVTLRTANDAKFTMIISFISMWAMRVGLSYLFSYFTDWGGMCIWYAMAIDWTLRSFFFVFRWRRGRWKQHYAIE